MMQTERADRFRRDFEVSYGEGNWPKFCELVWQSPRVQPQEIQKKFTSANDKPMSKPTYYKWEARAWEVKP